MIDDLAATPVRQTGECPTCQAPLASDQRYCVYCGTRAPQARLEALDTLRADAALPPRTEPATPADRGGLPLLAVVAALGVGALLGHWATPAKTAPTTPATQIIRLTGDAEAAGPAAATPAPAASATAAPEATATPAAQKTPAKDLSKDSIKKAVKKKAPISTGGTPVPKDNKAPGGGTGFQTIG
jgi:hypothetical protein